MALEEGFELFHHSYVTIHDLKFNKKWNCNVYICQGTSSLGTCILYAFVYDHFHLEVPTVVGTIATLNSCNLTAMPLNPPHNTFL